MTDAALYTNVYLAIVGESSGGDMKVHFPFTLI